MTKLIRNDGALQVRAMCNRDFSQKYSFQGLNSLPFGILSGEVLDEGWIPVQVKWNRIISYPYVLPSAEMLSTFVHWVHHRPVKN